MTSTVDRAAYAGFWRRFLAYAIDYALAIGASLGLLAAAALLGLDGAGTEARLSLVIVVGYFLYCVLLESSAWQATLGKRIIGIKVATRAGERIGLGRATARFFAKLLSAFTLLVGYLLIVVTARRQALHDLIAGTVVTHDRVPPRVSRGVVAIVATAAAVPAAGVAAAIALPAYQDYTIRAQVTEGLALAGAYRAAIEAAWRESPREFADFNSESVGSGLATDGRFVASLEVVSGMILVTYGTEAHAAIAGRALALVPALDARDALGWACGYGEAPPGFAVVFEGHAAYTDMPERYLPTRCRRPLPQ